MGYLMEYPLDVWWFWNIYGKTLLNSWENTLELWGKPLESRDNNSWSNICSNIWQRWILRRSLRSRFSRGGGHSKSSCKERLPVLRQGSVFGHSLFDFVVEFKGQSTGNFAISGHGSKLWAQGAIGLVTLWNQLWGVCLEMGDTFLTNDMILYHLYAQHGQNMVQNMV